MPHQLRRVDPMTVVGIVRRQSNDKPEEIGKQWQEFMSKGGPKQIPNRLSDDIYVIYSEYEGDHTKPYSMLIGCSVFEGATLPSGFHARKIPGALYATFEAKGPQPETLMATWKEIWSAPIERAFSVDFEQHSGKDDVLVNVALKMTGLTG